MEDKIKTIKIERAMAIMQLITNTATSTGNLMKDFPTTRVGHNTKYGRYIRSKQGAVMARICLTNIMAMAQIMTIQSQPIPKGGYSFLPGGMTLTGDNQGPEFITQS